MPSHYLSRKGEQLENAKPNAAELVARNAAIVARFVSVGNIRDRVAGGNGIAAFEDRKQRVRDAANQQRPGGDSPARCAGTARALDARRFRPSHPWRRVGSGRLLPANAASGAEGITTDAPDFLTDFLRNEGACGKKSGQRCIGPRPLNDNRRKPTASARLRPSP